MDMPTTNPSLRHLIVYGPDANCTLKAGPYYCDPKYGVYQYRPSIAANATFIALYFVALVIHSLIGLKHRTWFFTSAICAGIICELVGYGGRIMLHENSFSFTGFLIQIICITLGPTWFTAAIYLTLSKIVIYLGPQYSRFSPRFCLWIFIPCDIFSLCLQAVGGALSSDSSGKSKVAVDVAIAGLAFQVFTLCVFIALVIEYAARYIKARKASNIPTLISGRFKIFCAFLALSILLILIRCAYRIDELSDGYSGPLIHDETTFIVLEGVMVITALYCLMIAHPGPIFTEVPGAQAIVDQASEPISASTPHVYGKELLKREE